MNKLPASAITDLSTTTTQTAGEVKSLLLFNQQILSASGAWLHVWDLSVPAVVSAHREHSAEITDVCLSPDGRWLASASWDKTVLLWDASTLEVKHRLKKHASGVCAIAFSPDSTRLYSTGMDKKLHAWSVSDGAALKPSASFKHYVQHLLCQEDRLLAACSDGKLYVLDPQTLKAHGVLARSPAHPNCAVASPEQRLLVVADASGAITALHGEDVEKYKVHKGSCALVILFSDQDRVLSVGEDRTARIFSLKKKKELLCVKLGHMPYAAMILPGEESFIVANDRHIQQHGVTNGEMLTSFGGGAGLVYPVGAVLPSSNGREILMGALDGVCSYSLATRSLLWSTPMHVEGALLLSPDGAALYCIEVLTTSGSQQLTMLNARTGARVQHWPLPSLGTVAGPIPLDAERCLLASYQGGLVIRLRDGEILERLALSASSCAASDGLFALSDGKSEVALWERAHLHEVSRLKVGRSSDLALSPDGSTLIVAGWTGIISAWDIKEKALLWKKKITQKNPVVHWISESELLLGDHTGLYYLDSERELLVPFPTPSGANAIALLDGGRVVTGGTDGTGMLWDLAAIRSSEPPKNAKRKT